VYYSQTKHPIGKNFPLGMPQLRMFDDDVMLHQHVKMYKYVC